MSLFLASEINRKSFKNCKNQRVLEKRRYMYFAVRVNVQ